MMLATVFGAAALASGAAASGNTFRTDKGRDKVHRFGVDKVDEVTDTNHGCHDDIEIILKWHGAADLDLRVEGPDMCRISWANPLAKNGGILVEDIIPGTCDKDEWYEEVVKWGNGVAAGGIYAIDAHYYSDGGCDTGPVDIEIDVVMGGMHIETFVDTLHHPGDWTQQYYVLGHRQGGDWCVYDHHHGYYPHKKKDVHKKKHVVHKKRKGGRSLLSKHYKKDYDYYGHEHKCACFSGKRVSMRGRCDKKH